MSNQKDFFIAGSSSSLVLCQQIRDFIHPSSYLRKNAGKLWIACQYCQRKYELCSTACLQQAGPTLLHHSTIYGEAQTVPAAMLCTQLQPELTSHDFTSKPENQIPAHLYSRNSLITAALTCRREINQHR